MASNVDPLGQVEVFSAITSPGPSILGGWTGNSWFAIPLSLYSRSPSPGPHPESVLFVNATTRPLQSLAAPASLDASDWPTSTNTHVPSTYTAVRMDRSTSAGSSQFTRYSPLLPSPTSLSAADPPSLSHHTQPLRNSASSKRPSFMSSSELLASTHTSTHTLTAFAAGQSTDSSRHHVPSVSRLDVLSATASMAHGFAANSVCGLCVVPRMGEIAIGSQVPFAPCTAETGRGEDSIALLGNIGGQWEREGLGRSLVERIEQEVVGSREVGTLVSGEVRFPGASGKA